MVAPRGWCCPLPRLQAVPELSARPGTDAGGGRQHLPISVVTPSSGQAPRDSGPGRGRRWFDKTPEEADGYFGSLVDGCYKLEPLASELRTMNNPMARVDQICAFFGFKDEPNRRGVIVQVLRRWEAERNAPDSPVA